MRTEPQRLALLTLSRYVMGAQQEIGDALAELQWRQMQKVRAASPSSFENCKMFLRKYVANHFC